VRALRFVGKVLLALVALALIALALIYWKTQSMLRVAPWTPTAQLQQGDVVEGARLAKVMGCRGCHNDDLRGGDFVEEPQVFKLVAPNLTQMRAKYDDAGWQRLFRTGAKANGSLAVGMPVKAFQRLTDRELADLVAYVRSVPEVDNPTLGSTRLYPLARIGLLSGQFKLEEIAGDAPESATILAQRATTDRGEHLARTACGECHGMAFEGGGPSNAPPLIVAKAYDSAKFARLMHTGVTAAGTQSASGLMTEVAQGRFSALTDQEIAELHRFLQSR
jgi:mono/diheme cytochrome c family protein